MTETKSDAKKETSKQDDSKKSDERKEADKKDNKSAHHRDRSLSQSDRGKSHHDPHNSSRGRDRKDSDILTLDKIKEERERERERQRDRQKRQEERRREMILLRERQRQLKTEQVQREEALRLTRERERLRLDKQRLELEKLEAEKVRIALERERQKRERERILELEREQRRLEQQRLEQRRGLKRPSEDAGSYWSDAKRVASSGDAESRHHASNYDKRFEQGTSRYLPDRRDDRHRETARLDDKSRRDVLVRDDRLRHERIRASPPRNMAPDSRADWKSERSGFVQHSRDDRDLKTASGHGYLGPSGNAQTWSTGHSTHALSKTRGYTGADSSRALGTQWGDRGQTLQQMTRATDRDWASASLRAVSGSLGSGGSAIPVNQSSSSAFLSSAANILMSVGLAGSSRSQEPRYDGYKQLTNNAQRRY